MANFPTHPPHPERICWGCEKMCPANDMRCGNGTIRAPHPVELIGDDWFETLRKQEVGATSNPCAARDRDKVA